MGATETEQIFLQIWGVGFLGLQKKSETIKKEKGLNSLKTSLSKHRQRTNTPPSACHWKEERVGAFPNQEDQVLLWEKQ